MDGPPSLLLLKLRPQREVRLFPHITQVRLVKCVNREENGVFLSVCVRSSWEDRHLLYTRQQIR